MKVRRFMESHTPFFLSASKRRREYTKKSGGAWEKKRRPESAGAGKCPSSDQGKPALPVRLEVEAQAELHDARLVCAGKVQEVRTIEMGPGSSRIHSDGVGPGALVVDLIELRVIEHVEHFPFEVEASSLADGEALREASVKVQAAGIVQSVTADVAKGESSGERESRGVEDDRSANVRELPLRYAGARIADEKGTRTGAHAIGDAGAIGEGSAIGYAEGKAGLGNRDAGNLPATKQRVRQARCLEERQAVDIADGQVMAHVKSRTGAVGGEVIG